jgi:hypothetical protein
MKHCCAHDLLPPLLLLHQVRMIAAMLAPLLDVICNMPCLADPTVAAGVVASPLSAEGWQAAAASPAMAASPLVGWHQAPVGALWHLLSAAAAVETSYHLQQLVRIAAAPLLLQQLHCCS